MRKALRDINKKGVEIVERQNRCPDDTLPQDTHVNKNKLELEVKWSRNANIKPFYSYNVYIMFK